jgi:hypothetical protein
LYYPYSRWLDDVALKRAVLAYDRLLFVDPVDEETRADLYLREGRAAHANPDLAQRWMDAAANYELLSGLGIVNTVDRTVLDDDLFDSVVDVGLRTDLKINQLGTLFSGRRRWQMLEDRLSPSVYEHVTPKSRRNWDGRQIVEVPHAVAASITLTTALIVAHQLGVSPITDERSHDELLHQRLHRAALEISALPEVLRDGRVYVRHRVEMRLVGMLVPTAALRRCSMQDVVDFREAHQDTRRELGRLIDRLADQARHRPWDEALDEDLDEIAEEIRQKVAAMPGMGSARRALAAGLGKPSLRLIVGTTAGLTAYLSPDQPLVMGLLAGAATLRGSARDAVLTAYDELRRERTPEENALAYLMRAGGGRRR